MKKHFLILIFGTAILFILSGLSVAQVTNFSGTWNLNVEKSDFGMNPAPQDLTLIIKHKDKNLEIEQVGSGGIPQINLKFTTDGKESINFFPQGPEVKSICKWDKKVLVIETKMDMGGMEGVIIDKMSLSDDKLLLTIEREMKTQGITTKMVFNKAETPPPPPK